MEKYRFVLIAIMSSLTINLVRAEDSPFRDRRGKKNVPTTTENLHQPKWENAFSEAIRIVPDSHDDSELTLQERDKIRELLSPFLDERGLANLNEKLQRGDRGQVRKNLELTRADWRKSKELAPKASLERFGLENRAKVVLPGNEAVKLLFEEVAKFKSEDALKYYAEIDEILKLVEAGRNCTQKERGAGHSN